MDWQERLEQYRIYQAKLQLVDLIIDTKGLFSVCTGLDTISVNLLKLAELNKYPEVLHIPNFVNELKHISDEERTKRSNDTERVKKLYIPDNFNMTIKALDQIAILKEIFPNLDTISITTQQFKLYGKIDFNYELRIPQEASMKPTESTNKLIDYITARHEPSNLTATGTTLFGLFEIISRAPNEEAILAGISIYALENNLCTLEELKEYIPEPIYQSIERLNRANTSVYKAQIIKSSYWLKSYYDLKDKLGQKYGIPTNNYLTYYINTSNELPFDIGQKFKANLHVEKNIFHGFDGTGGLGYFRYKIDGEVSSSLALDIIRLTSDTDHIIDESMKKKLNVGCKAIDLSFFKQHWYTPTGNGKDLVWSYPDGTIQASGYNFGYSIQQIITESCILAAQFRGLSMNIYLMAAAPSEEEQTSNNGINIINISIHDGEVKVAATPLPQYTNSIKTHHSQSYIAKIDKLRTENKIPFYEDELQEIYTRNEHDLASEEVKTLQELLNLTRRQDTLLCIHTSRLLKETEGIEIGLHSNIKNPAYLYLRFLFDYDPKKLREYIEAKHGIKVIRGNDIGLTQEQ